MKKKSYVTCFHNSSQNSMPKPNIIVHFPANKQTTDFTTWSVMWLLRRQEFWQLSSAYCTASLFHLIKCLPQSMGIGELLISLFKFLNKTKNKKIKVMICPNKSGLDSSRLCLCCFVFFCTVFFKLWRGPVCPVHICKVILLITNSF